MLWRLNLTLIVMSTMLPPFNVTPKTFRGLVLLSPEPPPSIWSSWERHRAELIAPINNSGCNLQLSNSQKSVAYGRLTEMLQQRTTPTTQRLQPVLKNGVHRN